MQKETDEKLTHIVPILKQGKDGTKPVSYRPVNLLSTYLKLISLVSQKCIIPEIGASMLPSQKAYQTGKSTGDIVLAHKYFLTGSLTKRIQKVCAGIKMSRAIDTVDRKNVVRHTAEKK